MEVQLNRFFYPLLLFSYSLFAQVDYETQIQTIFNSNCTSCHIDGGAYYGGLDLSSYDSLMAGGNSGAVIVPSDHTNSYLWQRVNNGEMPPGNNPDLSSDEIDLIAQWIDEGALEIVGCADGEVELWDECYSIENTDSLDLNNSGLTGEIPPEIFDLTNLTYLNLGENQLTGSIPPEIGGLTNLTYLNLGEDLYPLNIERNQLTGSIPPEIGDLANLTYLTLHRNELTGSIPSEIGNLTHLTRLGLGWNQLTGSIPPEIGGLINPERLHLGDNQLTGSIPPEIGGLTSLNLLHMGNNQLTGSIPPEISDLTNLTFLHLGNNQLTGSIPPEIGNMTSLIGMNLGNNQLTGEIPESICDLNIGFSNSLYFNISNNQLCPPYPSCVEDHVGEQDTTNCEQVSIIDETLPITYKLHNAYPNPFNPVTTLRYDLPEDAIVNVTIYDMMGRHVNTIVSSQQSAGYKSIQWDAINSSGQPVSAGVYLYVIQAGDFRQTKKMVLLK